MSWLYGEESAGILHLEHSYPLTLLPSASFPLAGFGFLFAIIKLYAQCFQWVLWADLVNYQIRKGSGNPRTFSQLVKNEGDLRTPKLVTDVSSEGGIVGDYALNL